MANHKKDPEKTLDLPPHGARNADPVTDQPGSHPIETGIGAVLGGAASGLAIGVASTGPLAPVGAVVGAVIGAVAGGLAGKGVGELIDPTTEDNWIREYFATNKGTGEHLTDESSDAYRPAYRYGVAATERHTGKRFDEVESHLRSEWEREHAGTGLAWEKARGAVRDAYDRTFKLHEERLKTSKQTVKTGEVDVRKEVVTEHKQITVPVTREEVVIERRAVGGAAAAGSIQAEVIRIPVSEEKVHVTKETVVKEEVTVGKRKVQATETVGGDVRHEELKVETEGDVKVKNTGKK